MTMSWCRKSGSGLDEKKLYKFRLHKTKSKFKNVIYSINKINRSVRYSTNTEERKNDSRI